MPMNRNKAPICSHPGCERVGWWRGECGQHRPGRRKGTDPVPRFWAKVNKDGPTQAHMTTPCWVWTASRGSRGYGQFDNDFAHRQSWKLNCGEIPPGMLICHHCDNPPCIRPDHLFLGTNSDNQKDAVRKGRNNPQRGAASYPARHPELMPRGEDSSSAKLTNEDVTVIRAEVSRGASMPSMAARFKVSLSAIRGVVEGRTWRHLPLMPSERVRAKGGVRPSRLPLDQTHPLMMSLLPEGAQPTHAEWARIADHVDTYRQDVLTAWKKGITMKTFIKWRDALARKHEAREVS